MKTLLRIAPFFLLGCQAPIPEAEQLERDAWQDREVPGFEQIPDGVRPTPAPPETEPEPQPRTDPADADGPRFVVSGPHEDGPCWQIDAVGMPAVNEDGVVATVSAHHFQLSEWPGSMNLELLDESGSTETLNVVDEWYDAFDVYESEADDTEAACRRVRKHLRAKAKAANERLAGHRWRTMEPLPIQTWVPDLVPMELYREETPVAERPVQVTRLWGRVVARIVGVRVLESEPTIGRGPIVAAYADRDSGAVALMFGDCVGDSCTCDPAYDFAVHHWDDATFEAIDDRPCIPDEDADEDEGGGCDLTWQTPTADLDPFSMGDPYV